MPLSAYQLPLFLTSYIIAVHLLQLVSQYWYIIIKESW